MVNLSVGNFVSSTFGFLIVKDEPTNALDTTPESFSTPSCISPTSIVNLSTSGDALLTNLPRERKLWFWNGLIFAFLLFLNFSICCPSNSISFADIAG